MTVKVQNRIFDVFLGILLSLSFAYALTSSLNLKYPIFNMLFIIAAIFLICSAIFINRLSGIITLSTIGVGAVASVFYITFTNSWNNLYIFADDYLYWLADYIEYSNRPNTLFILITVIFTCILTSLIVYLFGVKHFIFQILLVNRCNSLQRTMDV